MNKDLTTTVSSTDQSLSRAELARVLASPEFSSSRQLQEFLQFISDRAFAGAHHLEQVEIAAAVLGRTEDFDPTEDATVRKLASLVRQRLESYYRRTGTGSGVVITLPMRSYVPRFEQRTPEPVEPAVLPEPPRRRPWVVWPLAALGILVVSFAILPSVRGRTGQNLPAQQGVVIHTMQGDLTTAGADAAADAVQLGPSLNLLDQAVVKLSFTPREEAQQAGLVLWQDADHYVRLGRRFQGRNQIAFSMEQRSPSLKESHQTLFDPEGQSGQDIWLSIRRVDNVYTAYLSTDGVAWRKVAEPYSPDKPFANPRIGIYAMNGRRQAASIDARFTGLATGYDFGPDGGNVQSMLAHGWSEAQNCSPAPELKVEPPALLMQRRSGTAGCNYELTRPLRGTEWQIATKLDYFVRPGSSASISVRGTVGSMRLARYFLNNPSIALIHDGRTLIGMPDLNGSPAVILRLEASRGEVHGAFSADGLHFEPLGAAVKLSELGSELRAGLRVTLAGASEEQAIDTARFYYYREFVTTLTPWK